MSQLSTKKRNNLPKDEFAMPGERKYPINDKNHARNALARASEMENKGKISESTKAMIDAKARRVLDGGERGSRG